MGKRKDGQSSNQTDCSSFSLEKLAKARATRLHNLEILLKDTELKKGKSSLMSSIIQPVSEKKSFPDVRRDTRWELEHSISTVKKPSRKKQL